MAGDYDICKFITLIKDNPEIWDYRTPLFRKRILSVQKWIQVCNEMEEDFMNKSSQEKDDIVKKYKTRWKLLRCRFYRHKRNITENKRSKITVFQYYENLTFLKDLRENKEQCINKRSFDKNNIRLRTLLPDFKKVSLKFKVAAKSEIVSIIERYNNYNVTLTDNNNVALLNKISSRIEHIKTGNKRFLMSLEKDFNTIPNSQKLNAYEEIYNVILKYAQFKSLCGNDLEKNILQIKDTKILSQETNDSILKEHDASAGAEELAFYIPRFNKCARDDAEIKCENNQEKNDYDCTVSGEILQHCTDENGQRNIGDFLKCTEQAIGTKLTDISMQFPKPCFDSIYSDAIMTKSNEKRLIEDKNIKTKVLVEFTNDQGIFSERYIDSIYDENKSMGTKNIDKKTLLKAEPIDYQKTTDQYTKHYTDPICDEFIEYTNDDSKALIKPELTDYQYFNTENRSHLCHYDHTIASTINNEYIECTSTMLYYQQAASEDFSEHPFNHNHDPMISGFNEDELVDFRSVTAEPLLQPEFVDNQHFDHYFLQEYVPLYNDRMPTNEEELLLDTNTVFEQCRIDSFNFPGDTLL